ncbi:hypothetical protein AB4Z46_14875 [Variovorax sp. M-6]|uniref:hypothetical protein n=1 Tax=Variovorax sp. M-6 TaxID=3233041 RepID=UPI003F972A3F
MAKSPRAPAPSPRKAASAALRIIDEFCNLKEVHRAFACLHGLLSPIHRAPRYEEFSIEPGDLRALMAVINIELERRTEPVEEAIRSLRKALKAKVR